MTRVLKIIALLTTIEAYLSVDREEHLFCPGDTVVMKCPVPASNKSTWNFNIKRVAVGDKINNHLHQASRISIVGNKDKEYNLEIIKTKITDAGNYSCLGNLIQFKYELKVDCRKSNSTFDFRNFSNEKLHGLTTIANSSLNVSIQDENTTGYSGSETTWGLFTIENIVYGVSGLGVLLSLTAIVCNVCLYLYFKQSTDSFKVEIRQEIEFVGQDPQNGYHTIDERHFLTTRAANPSNNVRISRIESTSSDINHAHNIQDTSTQTENNTTNDSHTTENSSTSSDNDNEMVDNTDNDYLHPYCGMVEYDPNIHRYEELPELLLVQQTNHSTQNSSLEKTTKNANVKEDAF